MDAFWCVKHYWRLIRLTVRPPPTPPIQPPTSTPLPPRWWGLKKCGSVSMVTGHLRSAAVSRHSEASPSQRHTHSACLALCHCRAAFYGHKLKTGCLLTQSQWKIPSKTTTPLKTTAKKKRNTISQARVKCMRTLGGAGPESEESPSVKTSK